MYLYHQELAAAPPRLGKHASFSLLGSYLVLDLKARDY